MEAQGRRRGLGRLLLLVVAAVLVVLLLVWLLVPRGGDALVSGPGPSGSPGATTPAPTPGAPASSPSAGDPTPTGSADPTAAPTPGASADPGEEDRVVAQEVTGVVEETEATVPAVERLVAETAQSVATVVPEGETAPNLEELEQVATGEMLQELEASVEEFRTNGWYQRGVPTLVSLDVGELSEDGTTVELAACLDSSRVQVIDEAGNDVLADQRDRRSLNLYVVERADEDAPWKVASRSFPDEADC
ncbi:hypothetical protein [Auraticoccus cholistanensis]|uniref:hypothetical protein n=1 Tax=Auraticoccus cholistanensis TaxID=2656650 RepID=UPI0018D1FA5A|nr:hypothetical protein [Auraticoccus cholistanensis]